MRALGRRIVGGPRTEWGGLLYPFLSEKENRRTVGEAVRAGVWMPLGQSRKSFWLGRVKVPGRFVRVV